MTLVVDASIAIKWLLNDLSEKSRRSAPLG